MNLLRHRVPLLHLIDFHLDVDVDSDVDCVGRTQKTFPGGTSVYSFCPARNDNSETPTSGNFVTIYGVGTNIMIIFVAVLGRCRGLDDECTCRGLVGNLHRLSPASGTIRLTFDGTTHNMGRDDACE